RPDPAVEPQGRDHRTARLHPGVGRHVRRTDSGGHDPRLAGCGEVLMKVVLFAGGMGMRMREFSESLPKPMVPIGSRPVIWRLMKYYAHYGHTEFIVCLGYEGEVIKEYFLGSKEWLSNDFVLSGGGREITMLHTDTE